MRRLDIAALAAVVVLGAACGGSSGAGRGRAGAPSPTATATLPPVTPLSAAGARRVVAGGRLDWLLTVGRDVWVAGASAVQRFDGTGRRTASVPATDVCAAMDAHGGDLWVASCGHAKPTLIRINAMTGRARTTIVLPTGGVAGESSIAAADSGIWVVGAGPPTALLVIDPATNKVTRTIPAPPGISALRAGFDSIWATVATGQVLRIDPSTGSIKRSIRVGAGASFLAVGLGSVWVLNGSAGTVSRIDPTTDRVAATVGIGHPVAGGDIAVGPDAIWVHPTDALAVRIDPATNTVTRRIGSEAVSGSIAATKDAVWITEHQNDALWRVPT